MKRILAATLQDMIDAFEMKIDALDGGYGTVETATYIDVDGGFGEPGAKYTDEDIRQYWDEAHDSDPVLMEYASFEDWWEDTKEWLIEDVSGCDTNILGEDEECFEEEYDEDYSE